VLVEADTLRERGCSHEPRSIRGAFLLPKFGGQIAIVWNMATADFCGGWPRRTPFVRRATSWAECSENSRGENCDG
jgi:hypothetical protein